MEKVENQFMVDILKVRPNILWSFISALILKEVWSYTFNEKRCTYSSLFA
jgi:hypothetical protein